MLKHYIERRKYVLVAVTLGVLPPDLDSLSMLKMTLEVKLKALKELDAEIVKLVSKDELETEIQETDEYEEKIIGALVQINHALTQPKVATPTTARIFSLPTVDDFGEARSHGAKVKLSKLSLPHFNGELMKWPTFWDSYESSIHTNGQLTNTDKFNYLRSLLEHPTLDATVGLTLSAAYYQQAIEILQKRFGNKPLNISKHMETLLSAEPVAPDQSLKELRRLYDTTESHLHSLRSLGTEPTLYGAMLSPVLLMKLPPELCLTVSRKISCTDLNMDNLLKTFEEELVARESASGPKFSHPKPCQIQEGSNTSPLHY